MNNELQKIEKRPLPKIDDLYNDVELASKQNDLNRLLNCQPKQEWIRDHPFAKNVRYLPIAIVEYLLTSIFIKWRVEVKSTQVIANAVQVTVRLHVQDPISGEWDWQDGIGAAPIQTKKDAAATDFSQVLTDAVMKAAPAAESYAIKDAAEKFGKIFGKDLNRTEFINYEVTLDKKLNGITPVDDLLIEIINKETDKDKLADIYKNNPEYHSNPKFMKLLNERKNELNGSHVSAA